MKTSILPWPVLVCAGLLAACGPSPGSRSQPTAVEQAEQESRRWQAQYQAEQTLREQADARSTVSQEARSHWQNLATIFAVAAVILLILGTILGSAARHESEQP